jgi:undecaprenyl-diphosphatase
LIRLFLLALILFIVISLIYPLEIIGAIDAHVTLFFESIRVPILTDVFLFISDIGSLKYMLPICFVLGLFLLFKRKVVAAIFVFVMLFSVRQVNYLLKELFSRERPDFNAVYEAAHYSFPSGHTMNSTAMYLFLFYLLMLHLIKKDNQKNKLFISTLTLIVLIGISRIYLGVHFLTDVIAGFSAGFAWFIVIFFLYLRINKRFDKNRSF